MPNPSRDWVIRRSRSRRSATFVPRARGLLEAISVPVVTLDGDPPLVYGRLSVGFFMDDRLAARFKELTGTEIAFASQGKILASSLAARDSRHAGQRPHARSIDLSDLGDRGISRALQTDATRRTGHR